SVAGRAQGM
uniref:Antimicrobial peptide 1 n=1 Tax=Cocos nucifera TaxID=13894 RepID=AMP1_COCNU|nr:RecName: Full=Antimicrobial peptide 1; Short=Cn-AMP1 [Cocos nucifera]